MTPLVAETVEEQSSVDPRFQAVLHAELIDFFSYYSLLNYRLRWFLDNYKFKDFKDLHDYYFQYVEPQLKEEQENADNKENV